MINYQLLINLCQVAVAHPIFQDDANKLINKFLNIEEQVLEALDKSRLCAIIKFKSLTGLDSEQAKNYVDSLDLKILRIKDENSQSQDQQVS